MPTIKSRYWIATLSATKNVWTPSLVDGIEALRGQLELSAEGYLHWQFAIYTPGRITLRQLKAKFPRDIHLEPSRNARAVFDYVHKDDTCVDIDSRFDLGNFRLQRNNARDWAAVRADAVAGRFDSIPDDIFIRHYSALRRIHADNMVLNERADIQVSLFWGEPGSGKTRRAFEEAGEDVFVKNPCTKWWDGYRGQAAVIIDDFDGRSIRATYLKNWLDRYKCSVEIKGGSIPLCATRIWITSNFSLGEWFDNEMDREAIRRRIHRIEHFRVLRDQDK